MDIARKFEIEVVEIGEGIERLNRTEYDVVTMVGGVRCAATMVVWFNGTISFDSLIVLYREFDNVGTCV